MREKTEDLELLTNAEISTRLLKIAKAVPQTFGALIVLSLVATVIGFQLNSYNQQIAGGIVSIVGALIVIAGAVYMRKMRLNNDALIEVSIKRQVESLK